MSLGNPLDPFNHLESPSTGKWYSPYIKPIIMVVFFVLFSYVTLWMGQHYVTNEKFGEYVKVQMDSDRGQDVEAKQRFEATQSKLEIIINNQTTFTEQLKAYNSIMLGMQKQIDNIDNRVIYLQRYHNERGDRTLIQPAK